MHQTVLFTFTKASKRFLRPWGLCRLCIEPIWRPQCWCTFCTSTECKVRWDKDFTVQISATWRVSMLCTLQLFNLTYNICTCKQIQHNVGFTLLLILHKPMYKLLPRSILTLRCVCRCRRLHIAVSLRCNALLALADMNPCPWLTDALVCMSCCIDHSLQTVNITDFIHLHTPCR